MLASLFGPPTSLYLAVAIYLSFATHIVTSGVKDATVEPGTRAQ